MDAFLAASVKAASQSAPTYGAHEYAEPPGTAVQDLVGENRHEHGVGHSDEADESQQDQQGPDRPRSFDVAEPFEMLASAEPGSGTVRERMDLSSAAVRQLRRDS